MASIGSYFAVGSACQVHLNTYWTLNPWKTHSLPQQFLSHPAWQFEAPPLRHLQILTRRWICRGCPPCHTLQLFAGGFSSVL